jgi:hypothetical protein
MSQFLACYEYGTGGVWLYVEAETASQVVERYPALTVFDQAPPWWTPDQEQASRAKVGDPWWSSWLDSLPKP